LNYNKANHALNTVVEKNTSFFLLAVIQMLGTAWTVP